MKKDTPVMQTHMLLVEDDRFVRDIYVIKFQQENFRVSIAVDGKQAIEFLEKEIPDIILLDIILPYFDGIEILKKLKDNERWRGIPVILLTNISERDSIRKCLELGADDYAIKSHFTPTEVFQKVRSTLAYKNVVQ